jgi:hypothetical protein
VPLAAISKRLGTALDVPRRILVREGLLVERTSRRMSRAPKSPKGSRKIKPGTRRHATTTRPKGKKKGRKAKR